MLLTTFMTLYQKINKDKCSAQSLRSTRIKLHLYTVSSPGICLIIQHLNTGLCFILVLCSLYRAVPSSLPAARPARAQTATGTKPGQLTQRDRALPAVYPFWKQGCEKAECRFLLVLHWAAWLPAHSWTCQACFYTNSHTTPTYAECRLPAYGQTFSLQNRTALYFASWLQSRQHILHAGRSLKRL